MSKPRLLFFSNLYPLPWQPTRAAYNKQITAAIEDNFDIDILIPVSFTSWFRHVLLCGKRPEKKNIHYFPFFYIPGMARNTYALSMLLSIIISVFPLIKIARSKKIITSWAFPDAVAVNYLKKLFRFRHHIYCLGTDINYHFSFPARRKMMLRAFQTADGVITVSQNLKEKISQYALPGTCIKTIYNGVNFATFSGKTSAVRPNKFLFIGNMIKTKGVFELLDAVALLKNSGEKIELGFVGSGPETQYLKDSATDSGVANQITFHGAIAHQHLPEVFSQYDALVLPSYREGIPNVIMEALAAGIPPIATPVGGIPEIIQDGINGVLIEPNTATGVAQAILRCRQKVWDPQVLRETIGNFTWENCGNAIASFIDEPKGESA